ncbi:hypothetical protein SAMN05216525_101116 [Bradyrhizobium sp. Gha]|nr:hypothetical protein SAMN05216525_101116 [Bradyrhizobium sp. Gha]
MTTTTIRFMTRLQQTGNTGIKVRPDHHRTARRRCAAHVRGEGQWLPHDGRHDERQVAAAVQRSRQKADIDNVLGAMATETRAGRITAIVASLQQ